MRKTIYFPLLLILFLWGCKSKSHIVGTSQDEPNDIVEYDVKTCLLFPADVLYVLGREYELINDVTSEKHKLSFCRKRKQCCFWNPLTECEDAPNP